MTETEISKKRNVSFFVKIQHCEHRTWQGSVKWIDENKEQPFRSALELIKLIDSATECSDMNGEE